MSAASAALQRQSDGRVLVASPRAEIRKQILRTLSPPATDAAEAAGGADALMKLEASEFRTLLLDSQLEDLDVEELVATVRARYPQVNLVVLDHGRKAEQLSFNLSAAEEIDEKYPIAQAAAAWNPQCIFPRATPAPELDDVQREKLVLDHLEQVQFVARRIHSRLPSQVLLEDLVHAGVLGLMDAVRKYDPSKNVQLKHYAEFRIRGAILDSLREVDWSPRTLRRQARRLERAIADCRARLGRDPSEPEIAAELQISLENLHRLQGDLRGLEIGSLESEADGSGGGTLSQCRAGSGEEDPYHQTLRSEMTGLLERAIDELPARQRQVLVLYHFEELTMKEIGAVLRVGESRVSQIHTAALLRLRARLPKLLGKTPVSPPCRARVCPA